MHKNIFLPALFFSLLTATCTYATPYLPAADNIVLEHLPFKASDATSRDLRRMREELSVNPLDQHNALALAQRYYQLALAEGDPRFIGYAQAALAPWWELKDPPVGVLVQRAALRQFTHNFEGALSDLQRAIQLQPRHGTAWSLLAAIHIVQADYATARQDCERLNGLASHLIVVACIATVDSLNGQATQAYQTLNKEYATQHKVSDSEKLWVVTRLAEICDRLGYTREAEMHFKTALNLNITENYLLAVYAEFLLDEKRYKEVINLLQGKERSDVLLMRLTLAETASNAPKANEHREVIRSRFAAARLRGDKLHIQDEARFYLHILKQPQEALRLAQENWLGQHEPSDARILLEAALASNNKAAAQPVVEWLRLSRIEDRHLHSLIKALTELRK
jgi:Flp pilus assembly protein TadD